MRGFSKFFKLGPVVLLALFAALVSLSTAAGSVAGLATTPTGTASTKPIANFALCKAPTETPTPRPTKGPSPTATTAPTIAPATPTAATAVTEAAIAETSTPTAEPPTAVPGTPTASP